MRSRQTAEDSALLRRYALKVRPHAPVALIVLGALLLLFVGTQYARSWAAQRKLADTWAKQQQVPAVAAPDGLTRLSIPKISLDAIVIEGTSRKDLLLGPGHLRTTAVPGDAGNSVITGHRDTFFRHLSELGKGDLVNLERNGELFRYEVTGRKIVRPDDLSVTEPSSEARLTLITCYPTYFIGPAPKRLVVFAKMMDSSRTFAQQSGDSGETTARK